MEISHIGCDKLLKSITGIFDSRDSIQIDFLLSNIGRSSFEKVPMCSTIQKICKIWNVE